MKTLVLILMSLFLAISTSPQSKKDKRADTSLYRPASTTTMFRMHYDDMFKQNTDATWSPKLPLMINGEMVGTNVKIARGVTYGGMDLLGNFGHDAMVDTARGVVIIRRFVK